MRLRARDRLRPALVLCLILVGCNQSARSLYERAETEAANQRGQLARHFYLKAIEKNSSKDRLRFDSLSGLANLCFDQLFEYREGMKVSDMAIKEFGGFSAFEAASDELRMKSAYVSRVHLQDPERSMDYLKPMIEGGRVRGESWREVGRVFLELKDFAEAESAFKNFWDSAADQGQCKLLQSAQLDLMQTFALAKNCSKALEWGRVQFPQDCKPDIFSVRMEMAHCLEIRGESDKAIALIQEVLNENPENYRAEYLIKNIKKRQKDKLSK